MSSETTDPGVGPGPPLESTEVAGADPSPTERAVAGLRRTRRVLWAAVAVAVPVAMLVLVLATREPASTRAVDSPLVGKRAPALDGTTVDGERVRLSDYRGKWVVVNFFATWCVPCRDEHPELVRFQEGHPDAQVVAVVYSDSEGAVKDFRARHGGDWPYVNDPKGAIAIEFGVGGVPESFLISPDGVVVSKVLGGVRADALEGLLREGKRGQG